MNTVYSKGTRVWLPDAAAGWVPGTVTALVLPSDNDPSSEVTITVAYEDSDGGAVTKDYNSSLAAIQAASESVGTSISPLPAPAGQDSLPPLRNPPLLESSEDLASLSNLNEPSVLHAIATRYDTHQPYTYSGIVLVALNPFSPVPLYTNDILQAYAGKKKGELEPHLFAIAEEALDYMRRGSGDGGVDPTGAGDQTIVVSGESGAGKTVSAKYILRYFASVNNPAKDEASMDRRRAVDVAGNDDEGMSEIECQILASNPIMEAFGNAKTTRNDNSSRFGKYIEVRFDSANEIVGAQIRTYLLERSRLVYQPETERNYHIFYQLLAGAPSKERKDLSLPADPQQFAYLSGGGPISSSIPGVDDAKEFRDTQEALSTVGISVERQWHIFKVLAALLHLGNVKITQSRTDAVLAEDDPSLTLATELLGLPLPDFKKWIIKRQLTMRNETVVKALSSAQATVVRDSVAKYIYSCLFDWLVSIVNDSLTGERQSTKFIGVLDIYGFEHFKKNSFEQFCINWANEKLQQEASYNLFNAHVFKLEQEEYMKEQINWTFIDFTDNQACIDIIEGKLGVLALLDEESRLPSGADASFANKLHQQLGKPEFKDVFKKPRFNQNAFTIAHYALDVTYDADGFIEKNRDTVPDEHLALLQASSNPFLREAVERSSSLAVAATSVPSSDSRPGPKRVTARKPTLGSIFKHSLISLMDTISKTNVHYIRCIKPNETKKAWTFEPQQVLSQLRACGVLETIRISCAGYPSRWTFAEFASRYYVLVPSKEWEENSDVKAFCQLLLQRTLKDENKYQVGLSKIFFRAGMVAVLESLRTARLNALVTLVQKNVRRRIAYKQYQELRQRTILIQAWWRGILGRQLADQLRKEAAAVRIQRAARGFLQRRSYLKTCQFVINIQSAARVRLAKQKFSDLRTESAANCLQCLFRGLAARQRLKAEIRRVVVLQSQWRRKLAVRELQALKVEAKSASKFKEISYHLENKVVELTKLVQKRTAENKSLNVRISDLEKDLTVWQTKYEEAHNQSVALEAQLAQPTVPQSKFDELGILNAQSEENLRLATKRIDDQKDEISRLSSQLERTTTEFHDHQAALEDAVSKHTDDAANINSLRQEVTTLKEQISRANALHTLTKGQRDAPSSPTFDRGLREFANGLQSSEPRSQGASRRRQRRHSTTGHGTSAFPDDGGFDVRRAPLNNPRAVSVMFPQSNNFRPRDSNGLPTVSDTSADEILRLLQDEESLDEDVLQGLITNLKIPAASLHNPPLAKEVIFPAHLISLVSNEMWKLGMIPESERFLANVMQSIQSFVMQFKGEEVIIPGIFWLSNVQEVLSFICVAESDAQQGIAPGMDEPGARELDWEAYERLVGIVKHDLDSLEYNIYHTWMLEVKKKLSKMVIPALIESQSLPGFITSDGSGRMFSRMMGMGSSNSQPTASMDDILNLLNKVWKCLKSYYMEESVMQQVVTELLKLIGTIAFNDLIMRRNFCSWKRAMQIQYNITRIEEWCKAHDMPEGLLQLEHLMQATKLLQLKKATLGDIEILFDVCWILSPSQIQKLISQYHNADYEAPISPEILKAVAARVRPEDKNDQLLLQTEQDEVGPYQIPPPRDIAGLETYVPAWLNVPVLRRLATFVA